MKRPSLLLIAILTLSLFFSATQLMAQGKNSAAGKGDQKKNPPFLITGKLPHLTGLLKQQWDNPQLQLTEAQKQELLQVRKGTITAVQAIKKRLVSRENQVVEGIFGGKSPEQLQPLVQSVADLKSEATMVHLRCIYNTSKILNQQQLELLRNL